MDDYGLRIVFSADWDAQEEGIGNYTNSFEDPGVDTLVKGFVSLIEATFGWGLHRARVIAKIQETLDEMLAEDAPEYGYAPRF